MKNITNQYKDLKEGKISQSNFMRNLRMTFPHLVTNVTSFDDSIKILKNKGLLNEHDIMGQQMAGDLEQERESRETRILSAFMQGYKASQNGVSIDENPFKGKMDEKSQEWADGWLAFKKKQNQMYQDTDPNLEEPIFENEETDEDIDEAINILELEKNNLLHTNPMDKDPEIISDQIDEINAKIADLKAKKMAKGSKKATWTGLDEEIDEAAIPPITRYDELEKGTEIEHKEHPELSRALARQIAKDHLEEDPYYYSKEESPLKDSEFAEKDWEDFGNYVDTDWPEWEPSKEDYDYIFEAKNNDKKPYDKFKEVDNFNAQEVLIGIDCELQMNPELSKEKATDLAIKNLKKDPNYYTNYKLAGKETKAEPMYKYKEGSDQMKPIKGENSFIDKDNAMKSPKGIEKIKASAAKANKETNKVVKGVEYMKLTAKTVRGVKRMDATGEKMKKINIKESLKTLIRQIIAENLQKPTEKDYEVAKDILDSYYGVNENVIENTKQAIQKYKNYANKGLMTAGVIALLNSACAPELTSGNYNAANMSRRDKQCAGSWYQSSPKKSAYMSKNYPGNRKGGSWWKK